MSVLNIMDVCQGKVYLIAGGGRIFTDLAARFVRSERDIEDIIASPYDKNIVRNIMEAGHMAALEFDYFLFAVQGFSRVTETQLVRKRVGASYMIKSGRAELGGKRSFSVVAPAMVTSHVAHIRLERNGEILEFPLSGYELCDVSRQFYDSCLEAEIPEEDARYLKPQGTEFKALIGMNAHALHDWFKVRCCFNAQKEIRYMANKILHSCKEVAPDLFEQAGASCKVLGYCPENERQCQQLKDKYLKKNEAMEILKLHKKG